jgi:hypothetical protein
VGDEGRTLRSISGTVSVWHTPSVQDEAQITQSHDFGEGHYELTSKTSKPTTKSA